MTTPGITQHRQILQRHQALGCTVNALNARKSPLPIGAMAAEGDFERG
jgi:hypothetical protein